MAALPECRHYRNAVTKRPFVSLIRDPRSLLSLANVLALTFV